LRRNQKKPHSIGMMKNGFGIKPPRLKKIDRK